MIGGAETAVLLRGENLLVRRVELAARSLSKARQALRFRLADELLSDPQDLHFCLMRAAEPNLFDVVVVDKTWLRGLLEQFSAAGIKVSAVYPDMLALPWSQTDGGGTLLYETERCVVRTGVNSGYAISRDIADKFHNNLDEPEELSLLNQVGNPNRFAVKGAEPSDSPVLDSLVVVDSPLVLFARGLDQSRSVNLLQGEFKRPGFSFRVTPVDVAVGLITAILAMSALWSYGMHQQYRYTVDLSLAELDKFSRSELGEAFQSTDRMQQQLLDDLRQRRDLDIAQPRFLQMLATVSKLLPDGAQLKRIRVTPEELELCLSSELLRGPMGKLIQQLPGEARLDESSGELILLWRFGSGVTRSLP